MRRLLMLGAMAALCSNLVGCGNGEAAVTKLQCSDMQRNHAPQLYKEKKLAMVMEGIRLTPEVDNEVQDAVVREVIAEAKTMKRLNACIGEIIE